MNGRRAGLAVAMMLVAEAGGAFGQSGIDALFFADARPGAPPWAVAGSGAVLLALSLGLAAVAGRVRSTRLFVALPVLAAAVLTVERFTAGALTLWLTAAAVQLVQGLSTWSLVGAVVDVRQAKRLFPLVGAARILGAVAGGLATRPLVQVIGAADLVLVWALGLALAAGLGAALVRGAPPAAGARDRPVPPAPPLARWMALLAVLLATLFSLLYVPFSHGAATRFADPDALAGFLGQFWAATAGGGFLLSLLVGRRLYARFGIPSAVAVLPLVYLAGFAVLQAGAGFAALVAIRGVQMVWMSGAVAPAWEAMVNSVPAAARDRTRTLLAGVAGQLGTLVGGILHIGASSRFGVGLLVAAGATYAGWRARRAYAPALLATLRAQWPRPVADPVATAIRADLDTAAALDTRDPTGALLRDALLDRSRQRARAALRVRDAVAVADLDSGDPGRVAIALEALDALGHGALVRPWEPLARRRPDRGLVDRTRTLRAAPPFTGLPPEELVRLAERARPGRFPDGARLAGQGDAGTEVHVVVHGTVRVLVDGLEVARRGPGEVVGEMALVTGEPRSATLVAAGPVGTLALDGAAFDAVLRRRPEVATAVAAVLSRRLAARRPGPR